MRCVVNSLAVPLVMLAVCSLLAACPEDEGGDDSGHCTADECPASITCEYAALRCTTATRELEVGLWFPGRSVDETPEHLTYYEMYLDDLETGNTVTIRSSGSGGRELGLEAWVDTPDGTRTFIPTEALSRKLTSFSDQDNFDFKIKYGETGGAFGPNFNPGNLVLREVLMGYKEGDMPWVNHKKTNLGRDCDYYDENGEPI